MMFYRVILSAKFKTTDIPLKYTIPHKCVHYKVYYNTQMRAL